MIPCGCTYPRSNDLGGSWPSDSIHRYIFRFFIFFFFRCYTFPQIPSKLAPFSIPYSHPYTQASPCLVLLRRLSLLRLRIIRRPRDPFSENFRELRERFGGRCEDLSRARPANNSGARRVEKKRRQSGGTMRRGTNRR